MKLLTKNVFEDCNQRLVPLIRAAIQTKALNRFKRMKKKIIR
jgi:hypothetical protein